MNFDEAFQILTGHQPFAWQRRLYDDFRAGNLPQLIDLPTGMGKTAVMAVWLLARECPLKGLPTRLVYVVDRRTVVDQATELAEKLAINAPAAGIPLPPLVSTLRGRLADNLEWTRDPSRTAIIIGTVDMVGSRLLFSGYRSRYKWRPLHAGLLGQDSLLILDEAHLSDPFRKLLCDIGSDGQFQGAKGRPMQVVCMSATSGGVGVRKFQLTTDDLRGGVDSNPVLERYKAIKRLQIHGPTKDFLGAAAKKAVELAAGGSRVVVFVRSPDDAVKIAEKVRVSGDKKNKPFGNAVEVLTGTMRGIERDELLDKPVMKRFLNPPNAQSDGPVILVSTSAGEVGFDLNADHMVCDLAPMDSMIQRLGRVNRRGKGEAQVHVFQREAKAKKTKDNDAEKKKEIGPTYESASAEALKVLGTLPMLDGGHNASPEALAHLEIPDAALNPKPRTVELTDILLDNWSMTTIVEPMPGRPPVADWLRGVADDKPETTIAWRAELDVAGFAGLDISDVEDWFDAHRVLPQETLTVPAYEASNWILERWRQLDDEAQSKIARRPCVIDRGGLRIVTVETLTTNLGNKSLWDIIGADIILPASFGGIERGRGLLDAEAPKIGPNSDRDTPARVADVADEILSQSGRRYRMVTSDESEFTLCGDAPPDPGDLSKFALDLPSDGDTVRHLVSLVPKRDRTEFGSQAQGLTEHVVAVCRNAEEIAKRLSLTGPVAEALQLAAEWHDAGKGREAWQNAVGGKVGEPLAKSGGRMQRIAGGYRHEFGSLREFTDTHNTSLEPEIFDLAAHLIAAHHGRGRPHFPKGGFDPDARAASPSVAADAMRRFARLQKKYGWWYLAWLESLLRCADAMASAEKSGENGK